MNLQYLLVQITDTEIVGIPLLLETKRYNALQSAKKHYKALQSFIHIYISTRRKLTYLIPSFTLRIASLSTKAVLVLESSGFQSISPPAYDTLARHFLSVKAKLLTWNHSPDVLVKLYWGRRRQPSSAIRAMASKMNSI